MSEKFRQIAPIALCIIAVIIVAIRLFSGDGDDASLTSNDPDKRLLAMEGLWQEDSPEARTKLREMTKDPDSRVILNSIRGMGQNRDVSNMRQLQVFAAPAPDREPVHRREALAALGNYKEVPVTEFTSVLSQDRDAQARAGAAQALARRADKKTIPAMYKALNDPDPDVRAWAITGIKNIAKVSFVYEPANSPTLQQEVIQQIGAYLRKNGYL